MKVLSINSKHFNKGSLALAAKLSTLVLTTRQLKALFKTADAALANMDTAVEIVRLTHPDFYNGYQKARKIIYTGTGSLAVKALVTDAFSGEPIKGVTVSFSIDGVASKAIDVNAKPNLVKKTAEKGGFNVKTLPAGVYYVTLKKNGYADQVTTIAKRKPSESWALF